ncbi:MAG TPA: hypothetical protein VIJ04_15035 [Xanthobacteraceae bacterium]
MAKTPEIAAIEIPATMLRKGAIFFIVTISSNFQQHSRVASFGISRSFPHDRHRLIA